MWCKNILTSWESIFIVSLKRLQAGGHLSPSVFVTLLQSITHLGCSNGYCKMYLQNSILTIRKWHDSQWFICIMILAFLIPGSSACGCSRSALTVTVWLDDDSLCFCSCLIGSFMAASPSGTTTESRAPCELTLATLSYYHVTAASPGAVKLVYD